MHVHATVDVVSDPDVTLIFYRMFWAGRFDKTTR
jgi:hypothetical protein